MDRQRNDCLGGWKFKRCRSEHRRNLLRAIWSNSHTHYHAKSDAFAYSNADGDINFYTFNDSQLDSYRHCVSQSGASP